MSLPDEPVDGHVILAYKADDWWGKVDVIKATYYTHAELRDTLLLKNEWMVEFNGVAAYRVKGWKTILSDCSLDLTQVSPLLAAIHGIEKIERELRSHQEAMERLYERKHNLSMMIEAGVKELRNDEKT